MQIKVRQDGLTDLGWGRGIDISERFKTRDIHPKLSQACWSIGATRRLIAWQAKRHEANARVFARLDGRALGWPAEIGVCAMA